MGIFSAVLPLMLLASAFADGVSSPSATYFVQDRAIESIADTCESESVYDIEVIAALPSGRGQVILTSPYSLKVSRDTVESALPYYGRAYNVPYGGGRGLFFSGRPEEYSDVETKPGQRKISFKVRTDEDLCSFAVTIDCRGDKQGGEDCTAFITVSSGQRQTISYRGRVVR